MKLTRADISFAQNIAFIRQFPNLVATNQTGFSAEASIHGCVNSHAKKSARVQHGQNWHNTLAIINSKRKRNEDWTSAKNWIFEGPYGPIHQKNVLRLLRRLYK